MHASSQAGLASFAPIATVVPTIKALVHPLALAPDAITSVPRTIGVTS